MCIRDRYQRRVHGEEKQQLLLPLSLSQEKKFQSQLERERETKYILINFNMDIEQPSEKKIMDYVIEKSLGEGTYGKVYKGIHIKTSQAVAIKSVKLNLQESDEGIPSTTIREISILQNLKHTNIVKLIDVSYNLPSRKMYLVFEFVDKDLKRYLDQNQVIDGATAKSIMYQLLQGVYYCHANRTMHRDLKPQNILISNDKIVKICDFGLARTFSMPQGKFTREIATLWYRAPELMMGECYYSISVDIWALGCIFAEIIKRGILFDGDSQIDMLYTIFRILGTPDESIYPGISKLPEFKASFPKFQGDGLQAQFSPTVDKQFIDLLKQMLKIDPNQRITAREALHHPYFDSITKKQGESSNKQ
eukprot:TRINITY_DN23337_c0_g1_i1.p1 TRINITY_DN23337_c0_g1~~TRINITY_DN23337_c0_g1_i1.p1  ORF type:complete len:363 (+),score=49.90 TRINITY_DN23337_c0_g1_i1:147-1235(+)